MKQMIKKISDIAKRIGADDIFVYSAQGSFYIIIASLPFIMLLLSLAQYMMPVSGTDILHTIEALIPTALRGYVQDVIAELFEKSNSLISITAITTLWSASRGFAAVERGIKRVYHTPNQHNFIVRVGISILYTVIFAALLLGMLVVLVFGESLYLFLKTKFGISAIVLETVYWVRPIFFFVVVCLFFALIYKSFSGKKMRYRSHLPGAIFTATGWTVFSYIFSIYIENFANYSYIYGSLTAVVLMLLWLYACMVILLLGAEVNMFSWEYKERKRIK